MKYNVGYLGNNEFIEKKLSKYYNSSEAEKISYYNLQDIDSDTLSATSFNGIVFDTNIHNDEEYNILLTGIISTNPDIDVMPIISDKDSKTNFDELAEIENETKLFNDRFGISTIPYFVNSEREAEIFMNTIFSTLSSKTIRNIEEIENYKIGARENMLKVLKKIIITLEMKDPYTKDHSRRVANYAKQIAIAMNLPEEKVAEIEAAGWLHDIGKLAINDSVLLKPDKLDDDEFFHMRSHAALGGLLLNNLFEDNEFDNIKDYAKHHHERYDGRGYPDKIAGEYIPLGARILCLADSFDAMTTQRSYNRPKKLEDALFDLKSNAGGQFDPQLSEIFIQLLKQEPKKLKETLGITIDSDGYIQVEHGPAIDKEKIKTKDENLKNDIDIIK